MGIFSSNVYALFQCHNPQKKSKANLKTLSKNELKQAIKILKLRLGPQVSAQLVSLNTDKGSDEKWHMKALQGPRQSQGSGLGLRV